MSDRSRPQSFASMQEAMEALRGRGDVEVRATDAGLWIRPLRKDSAQKRADNAREQAQRLLGLLGPPDCEK
jgi:hypothetical protein